MSSDLIGRQFGSYKVDELVERSGMVEVYRAHHAEIGRNVTVKVIGRHLESDPLLNERFRREAKAIIQLRHPNIVQLYDFGETGGGHYAVTEYAGEGDLDDLMRDILTGERYVDQDDVNFIVRQIASALDYAHNRNIVHFDVTPANVLVRPSGQVLLSDFGLAMLKARSFGEPSGSSVVPGTPEYMAPEQALDPGRVGPRSEIYSLGIILYQLVTGQLPFSAETPTDLALRHLNEPPPDARQLNPTLPYAVSQVIFRALSKEPGDRFDTALALADALTQAWHIDDADSIEVLKNGALQREGESEPIPRLAPAPDVPEAEDEQAPAATELDDAPRGVPRRGEASASRLPVPPVVLVAVVASLAVLGGVVGGRALGLDVGQLLRGVVGGGGQAPEEPLIVATPTGAPTQEVVLTATPSPTPGLEDAGITATPVVTVVPESAPLPTLEPVDVVPLEVGAEVLRLQDTQAMVYVPGGPFLMGTTDLSRPERERPQHEVMLSGFWIDKTEVTNAQYRACVELGACPLPVNTRSYDDPRYSNIPVAFITWDGASAYCFYIGTTMGLEVRLPTEAQWEKAASWDPFALTKRTYPWGEEAPSPELLRYNLSFPAVLEGEEVGSYPAGASPYGVLDMAGNMLEFVFDWSSDDYYSSPEATVDPQGPAQGSGRVVRGGSWARADSFALTTRRVVVEEATYGNDIGFRCAANVTTITRENNVAFTPQEALGGAQAAVALALAQAEEGTSQVILGDWQAALISLDGQLEAGDDAGVLAEIDLRLEALDALVESGNIPQETALKLSNTLRWVSSQLSVAEEPVSAPPEEGSAGEASDGGDVASE